MSKEDRKISKKVILDSSIKETVFLQICALYINFTWMTLLINFTGMTLHVNDIAY